MDILIVKLGALGDVINTLPLAIALKEKLAARIHWVVAPLSYPLIDKHEAVDRAILFDSRQWASSILSLRRQIRSRKFDFVLDLQRILKSGLICCMASGRRKIGFDRRRCKEMTWALPFERIPAANPQAHMVYQYLEFGRYLGIQDVQLEWRIPSEGPVPKNLPSEYVVLNIGATKPANRWTIEGFTSVARMVQQKYRLPSVLTGGPEDVPMAESIQALAGTAVQNWVGRTSLSGLVHILDASRLVVTCDTGPMHLSVALGKKVIALFGPSDHRRTGPFHGRVIRGKIDCAPCNHSSCDSPACMTAIKAEHVLRVLSDQISLPA
jgi:ADP-heptose:LPS heptosyltransferase